MEFESSRSKALDIALSVRSRLQEALSSAKHGMSNTNNSSPGITIRKLLYAGISDVETITIHHNTSRYLVLFRWYSMSTVRLRDIYLDVNVSSITTISLSKVKMDLYVLTLQDIATGLNRNNKDVVVASCHEESGICIINISSNTPDILNKLVRKTGFSCSDNEWSVSGEQGDIITTFNGNKFANVMSYADVTLSTNVNVTISYMGRIKAMMLYNKYARDEYSSIYLANILCSKEDSANTYSNISIDDPIKSMSIRSQENTLIKSALNNSIDDLVSIESRLMIGVSLEESEHNHTRT